MMRVAELCAGYGGLYLSMRAAGWPVELAWTAETDPDASAVLAAQHPGVPNVGDIATAQFTACEPVDVLACGYPCQPFSAAGLRKGLDDERWIWPDVARAVRLVRPRWVLLENVPGHLAWGFPRVVADLAGLGYVGSWTCVRASDVGAPHRRERLFILAADTERLGQPGRPASGPVSPNPRREGPRPPAAGRGSAAADADREPIRPEPVTVGARHGAAVAGHDRQGNGGLGLLPTPRATRGGSATETATLLPTPRASDGAKGGPNQRRSSGQFDALPAAVQPDRWGRYAPAVARWGTVLGRPAPDPTEPGRSGAPRLSARFVEWLMGLPAGWVTDHVGRNAALRILGNGVVPQQGAHALIHLDPPGGAVPAIDAAAPPGTQRGPR
jgi:DNA (cytosine-5)-methyltransferase 1